MYFQIGTKFRVWQFEVVRRDIVQEAEQEPLEHHDVRSSDLGFQREPEYYEEEED